MFICNHCPFVIHVNPMIIELAKKYQEKGIAFVAISSNDVENYPQDSPDLMKQKAKGGINQARQAIQNELKAAYNELREKERKINDCEAEPAESTGSDFEREI